MTEIVALGVLLGVLGVSVWAWWRRPGRGFLYDFATIWTGSVWGKQLLLDFFGLSLVLLLWMGSHAHETGSWLWFWLCALTMPLLGASSAAAYWLIAVGDAL